MNKIKCGLEGTNHSRPCVYADIITLKAAIVVTLYIIIIIPFCNFVRFFTICMMKLLSIISRMRIQSIPGRLSLRGLESRLSWYKICTVIILR